MSPKDTGSHAIHLPAIPEVMRFVPFVFTFDKFHENVEAKTTGVFEYDVMIHSLNVIDSCQWIAIARIPGDSLLDASFTTMSR